MTSRRRLALGIVAFAVILVFGRAAAVVFADLEWYRALGAREVWSEKAGDIALVHTVSAVFAAFFALVNLYAVRRSIVSLAFPRRLANVEFGEEVPEKALDRAAFVLAGAIPIAMAFAVPSWKLLAAVRLNSRFGETDPFFQMDMSFYTAWLPLESAVYMWCFLLLALVSAVVVFLYALTPSLRWQGRAFHVSTRVRRHLSVLASLFLVTMAWSYRLDGYDLLANGSGANGMFSSIDHQWLLPAYLSLSIGTVAAAVLVLLSGWMGHVRAGFFTISAVLIFAITLDLVLPSAVRRLAGSRTPATREIPYIATRAAFTARAYNQPRVNAAAIRGEVTRFASFSDSARLERILREAKDSSLVYPGASGSAIVKGIRAAAAPLLGTGLRRLANAWAEQRLDLFWSDYPSDSRLARKRDVRERAGALFPLFAQGSNVIPAYLGDTLVWVLEVYSASTSYPLSEHLVLAGHERSYFRHAGTVVTNARTGRVTMIPARAPDVVAAAWRNRFPQNIRRGAPDLLDILSLQPESGSEFSGISGPEGSDAKFRADVSRFYLSMRGALASGNLKAFAEAYDSLGALLGHREAETSPAR